ncbi:hypothetical protein LJC31_07630 [Synergistaceae bacterium OttesenSCG-928-I11]|nr:hypothetical protein [Synergistaceae bacterium OttesenSCG-928-I11]
MASATRVSSTRRQAAASGTTLVELLIAVLIMVIIGGIVVSLFANYINMFLANNDVVVATQRADSVFRLLEEPILHAGLGLNSTNAEKYRENWSDVNYSGPVATLPFPAWWKGNVVPEYPGKTEEMDAVILSGDRGNGYYASIGIVYAVPTGMKIEGVGTPVTAGADHAIILLDHNLPNTMPFETEETDMRSWLTVPGTNKAVPMLVKAYSQTNRTIDVAVPSNRTPELPMHQELYRMKAIMAYVQNNRFEMMDITAGSAHHGANATHVTTIDGVRGVRFKLSEDRKYIEVRLLVMGDSRDAKHAQTLWTHLRGRWSELTEADAGTYFEEFVIKWRVRDLGERS